VAHERSYEEVRGLVLLLAEQPMGRDMAERLKRIVVHADRGWIRAPKISRRSQDFPSL
jgi:hypothetical protein